MTNDLGADFNTTEGLNYPGVALYHDGMDLVAIVSTEDDVWKLQVPLKPWEL